ncbi:MAG: twin-arginine translocation signal domain-containing protein [Planctomycetaceae bacterium]|nr:twin-arginine translocation signal domain-containing protein [Planctomycetaceae bacterium]
MSSASRRRFLQTTTAAAATLGLSQLDFLGKLPRVSAQEAQPDPKTVRFTSDIEPLVRVIEETPRERLLEEVAGRIRKGTTYREVVAALLLAGVRNIQPRPSVGFKFHAVLVVNSAHLASISSPDEHRWLPIFWALDAFKSSQSRDVEEGNWTMGPVDEGFVPPPHQARQKFLDAMNRWDEGDADAAVAGLARTAGSNELFDTFARLGCRDFRSIGHKAIYVANAWRTLNCVGWQYAEPVLRSLAYALLNHEGQGNPAENDFDADRPGRDNLARAKKLREDWQTGKVDDAATRELLATIYGGSTSELCDQVVEIINRGISPQSVWDALLVGSGELLMRQPGIVGLHTLTTTNAMRYAYGACGDDETRRMLLLQNAAFLPLFRREMQRRGSVSQQKVEALAGEESGSDAATAVESIFASISTDRMLAARQTLAFARAHYDIGAYSNRARTLVFFKGDDSHDYKFSSAVLEDFFRVSGSWRPYFLAASVFHLRGSGGKDNELAKRTQAALEG